MRLADKNIYVQQEKLLKPLIDKQDEVEKLDKVEEAFEPLKRLAILDDKDVTDEQAKLAIEGRPVLAGMQLGNLATQGLGRAFSKSQNYDFLTGFEVGDDGGIILGNKKVKIDDDDIIVDNERYNGTPGLWNLITSMNPVDLTPEDKVTYIRLMKQTGVMGRKDNPKNPTRQGGPKWSSVQRDVWFLMKGKRPPPPPKPPKRNSKQKKGYGVVGEGVEFLLSRPEELVKMFKMAIASNQAGNTGERNRIVSILEALLSMGTIDSSFYRTVAESIV